MRSLQEIDAEIDAVKARLARRAEGLPTRESPEYRASRFDYVVDGNRQGLDQYQTALQTAMQNKLQRELTEREGEKNRQNARVIAQMGRDASAATDQINWARTTADAEASLRQTKKAVKEGKLDIEDLDKAQNLVDAQYALGRSRGWYTEPPKPSTPPEPEFDAKAQRDKIQAILDNDKATADEIATAKLLNVGDPENGVKGLDSYEMGMKIAEKERVLAEKETKAAYEAAASELDASIASKDADKIDAAIANYEKHKDVEGYKGDKAEKARKEADKIRKNNAYKAKGRKVLKTVTYDDVLAADADKSTKGKVNKEGYDFKYKWLPDNSAVVTFDGVSYKIPRP